MISALNLTAVLCIGIIAMVSAVGMGVYLFKQSQVSE